MEGSRIEEFCSRVHIECMALGGFTEFRRQAVSLTVFRDQTGTFASQCFGERLFCLTVFRRETLLHSVSATGTFAFQSFGDRQFLPHKSFQ